MELLRDYEPALADFDEAVAVDPTIIPHWRSERGMLLGFLGRFDEAKTWFKLALSENPRDQFACYGLAVHIALSEGLAAADPAMQRAERLLKSLANTDEGGIAAYRLAGLAALRGREDVLDLLERALPRDFEAVQFARHDLVWRPYHGDARFLGLITDETGDLTQG